MKKNYLYAILAFSLGMVSCEPTEETLIENSRESKAGYVKNMAAASTTGVNYINIYRNLLNNFEPQNIDDKDETAIKFEQYALNDPFFKVIVPEDYQNIQLVTVDKLMSANEDIVDLMIYSDAVKQIISNVINKSITLQQIIDSPHINENEMMLLVTLYSLHNDGNGNDDRWKINRAIAFAYGSQSSIADGLMYSGIIEVLNSNY